MKLRVELRTTPTGVNFAYCDLTLTLSIFYFLQKFNELADTRVFCGLINSFAPDLFPTEIMLNDRYTSYKV